MEVAQALQAGRLPDGDAGSIFSLVVESRREGLAQLLTAVDGVLSADASLHARVRERLRVSLPESWNLRVIQDNLGLFSTNVRFIGESIDGDKATVTLQEGDHVPLIHARFVRVGGQWQHDPAAVDPGVCEALDRLAAVIRDVETSVEQGAPFESLADAFTFRILPRIVAVSRAATPAGTR